MILGIRPEDFEYATADGGDRRISAEVDIREDMGSEVFIHFAVGGRAVSGEDVRAAVGADAIDAREEHARRHGSLFVARLGRGTALREGERTELEVAPGRAHFFDPETGLGIYGD